MKFLWSFVIFIFAVAAASPITAATDAGIIARNDASTELDLASDVLILNIDPDLSGPVCGSTFDSNINIKQHGVHSSTSSGCTFVEDYITVPGNSAKSKDVNINYICPGTPEPTDPQGYGTRDIKFILNAPSVFPRGQTLAEATLRLLNIHDNTDRTVPVNIGYQFTSNSELRWQFIYCP